MTETPVPRLVLRLAVPSMVSMVVTALYNVVDAAFVGHLSTEATAGIGISFAYMTFIQAVGFFFGHGSGNHISTPDVVPYACSYLRYILIATPFMMSALVLNNQLRLQGNARFGMIGIVSGAVLNIVLDPLFIFVLDLGVAGASIATAVSQMFAWGLLLWGTTRDESVHIRLAKFKPSFGCYKEIVAGGLPSLFRQAFNCVSVIMLNFAASKYAPAGQAASSIAAFAIVSRTTMFAFSLILGFTQGFQPVCGFNYGAHKYGRVRQSYLFAFSVSAAMLTLLSALGFIFAPQIIAVFRDEDPALLAIGTAALRWQCVVFPLCTLSTSTNMLFQNIRMTFPATLLAIGRQGLFFVPAILVLPRIFGLQGVEMTQAVADVCTFFLSLPFAVWINRKLKSES